MDFLLVALMAVFGWMKKSKSDKKSYLKRFLDVTDVIIKEPCFILRF